MSNISGISISTIFGLGAAIVLLHASLSSAVDCKSPVLRHSVYNKTSESKEILTCVNCRKCKPGREPIVACGTTLDIYESVGGCKDCDEGTYSQNEDTKQCLKCRNSMCFEHQVSGGTCTDKEDTSNCIDKCDDGYVMNKAGDKCIVYQPQPGTTEIPGTNSTPTTTKKPVVPNNREDKAELPISVIVVIVVFSIGGAIAVIAAVCYCLRRLKRKDEEDKGDEDDFDEGGREAVTFSLQEEQRERAPATANAPHCKESTRGYVESNVNASDSDNLGHAMNANANAPSVNPRVSHIANDVNRGYRSHTPPPPMNSPVVIEMPVQSPADIVFGSLAQPLKMAPPQLPPPINPTRSPQHYFPNNASPGLLRFDDKFPFEMYDRICQEFDTGPVGKNWRDLAGWLGLSVEEVRRIEHKEYKTHEIIQIWIAEAGNDVDKFIQILNEKKMTYLAGEINKVCRPLKI